MKRLLLAFALLLVALLLLPHAPFARRLVAAEQQTCEGRFEGRWRLLPSEHEREKDLSDGADHLEITIDDSYDPVAGSACPSLWGAVIVDGGTRAYHSSVRQLVFNDGDSFVTDPSGETRPLEVLVWKEEYRWLAGLLRLVRPLGEESDQLELTGYVGGRQGMLRYERER